MGDDSDYSPPNWHNFTRPTAMVALAAVLGALVRRSPAGAEIIAEAISEIERHGLDRNDPGVVAVIEAMRWA